MKTLPKIISVAYVFSSYFTFSSSPIMIQFSLAIFSIYIAPFKNTIKAALWYSKCLKPRKAFLGGVILAKAWWCQGESHYEIWGRNVLKIQKWDQNLTDMFKRSWHWPCGWHERSLEKMVNTKHGEKGKGQIIWAFGLTVHRNQSYTETIFNNRHKS